MILVRDLMHRGVVTCHLETSIRDIAYMMEENDIRSVVVTDDLGKVSGLISILSIFGAWNKDLDRMTAEDILLRYAATISPDSPIEAAVELMQQKRIEHLIIVNPETQRAVGILTTFDIVQYMAGIAAGSTRRGVTELGELT